MDADVPMPDEAWQRAHPGWQTYEPDHPAFGGKVVQQQRTPGLDGATTASLAATLDANAWACLDIPPEPKLLGDLVTPSSRTFLIGSTGLGKTLLAYALAAGMATGTGFLHWRCERPSRWLVIDGEMPSSLIKRRITDVIRRAGHLPAGALSIYSLDRADEFAKTFPGLGRLEPLNTAEGQAFVLRLATTLKVDGVVFDNVMSLISGDQKEEQPWAEAQPLVTAITSGGMSQIWLDHTGHNTTRQYGSSTKSWRFDAVGIMTPLAADQRADREVAFSLSFEPPGKARRRTPENWQDFAAKTIRLAADTWTSDDGDANTAHAKLAPMAKQFYGALLDALARSETLGETTKTAWYLEAGRLGLAEPIPPNATWKERASAQANFRKQIATLRAANLIGVDGERVTDLRPKRQTAC